MNRQTHNGGFSLIEMLISLVGGLVLLLGAMEVMVSTKNTFQTNDDVSRIQENGRFSLDLIVNDVRMAGYREPGRGDKPAFFLTTACDTFDPCTENGADTAPDRFAVQYDPENDLDCTGTAVAVNDLVANVYRILEIAQVNTLTCRGWNVTQGTWVGAERPLISGVDNLQVLYGTRVGTSESVTQYVSADRVADWNLVQAVRIAVLVNRGTENGQSEQRTRSFVVLDSPLLSFTDRHVRRVYNTAVVLNNAFI